LVIGRSQVRARARPISRRTAGTMGERRVPRSRVSPRSLSEYWGCRAPDWSAFWRRSREFLIFRIGFLERSRRLRYQKREGRYSDALLAGTREGEVPVRSPKPGIRSKSESSEKLFQNRLPVRSPTSKVIMTAALRGIVEWTPGFETPSKAEIARGRDSRTTPLSPLLPAASSGSVRSSFPGYVRRRAGRIGNRASPDSEGS